jgi:hypothetical protein
MNARLGAVVLRTWRLRALRRTRTLAWQHCTGVPGTRSRPLHSGERPLLDFPVAAGEAELQGTASPSLLPVPQGAERLPKKSLRGHMMERS